MKKITALFVIMVVVMSFTGCTSEEFCNLVSFTENFTKSTQQLSLSVEDYIIDGNIYYAFFPDDEPVVLLKLCENEQNKLESVTLTVGKHDATGNHRAISQSDTDLFYQTAKTAVNAFTGFTEEESRKICDEFFLFDPNTIKKQGETNKTQGCYRFVFYSNSLVSMFTITNTWLCPVEKTEKPESKPYFGNTTNVDGEKIKIN